ncbi:MAG: radical SAM protein, partial [Bacteroidales bacterium]|nr:radical SAM protein [Bacteroidales bacterium]
MRQSKYNVWVDNILYNSFTDKAISFLESEINDIKCLLDNPSKYEQNNENLINSFLDIGFLIKKEFDELNYILFKNRLNVFQKNHYHLTINPTLQCNYKCWYCIVEEVNTKYECRRMDDSTIKKVKNHIKHMILVQKINSLHIDWFGGEPLMYFYEVVLPISSYAKDLCDKNNVQFSTHATTNAFYIDGNMIELFKEICLNSFQIPIDGSEKKHNSVKNIAGIGHYKKILNIINEILLSNFNAQIILRLNYDNTTLKNAKNIINDLNVRKDIRSRIFVDFQRVWQVNLCKDENGNNSLLIEVKKEFEKAGYNTSYFALGHNKNYTRCYADSFYHRVINYDGKVFKCSARDYSDELSIGVINDDGEMILNNIILSKMFNEAFFQNQLCLKCEKLPLCLG